MARIRYTNPNGDRNVNSFRRLMRWQRERRKKVKDLSFVVPQELDKKHAYLETNRVNTTITWIGHSSFLIQIKGLNIVTDIVWARRMGLDVRLSDPGLTPEQMPEIDVVLISHSHYDHLDIPSIRKLKGNPIFLVPIGLKSFFEKRFLFKDELSRKIRIEY